MAKFRTTDVRGATHALGITVQFWCLNEAIASARESQIRVSETLSAFHPRAQQNAFHCHDVHLCGEVVNAEPLWNALPPDEVRRSFSGGELSDEIIRKNACFVHRAYVVADIHLTVR
jgi:hypothetical protein